jgi:hypothetical protein
MFIHSQARALPKKKNQNPQLRYLRGKQQEGGDHNFLNIFSNGGKVGGGNKLLSKSKITAAPYSKGATWYGSKCKTCKAQLHKPGIYCQTCAYTAGVCSICGKKIIETTMYKQSME